MASLLNSEEYPSLKRIPNLLTLIRILLAPVFLILFLQEDWVLRSASVLVFTVAAITDYLDGYLARALKARSEFGVFMDPLADKVLTFLGFAALSIMDSQLFPWWVFALIAGRDLLVTFMRSRAKTLGFTMKTSFTAKLKTAVQLVFLYIALLAYTLVLITSSAAFVSMLMFESGLLSWLYFGVMLFTVYTGVEYMYKNNEIFRSEAPRRT